MIFCVYVYFSMLQEYFFLLVVTINKFSTVRIFLLSFFGTQPKIGSFRLPTHSRDAHIGNFWLMISSEIEILGEPSTFGTLDSKGFKFRSERIRIIFFFFYLNLTVVFQVCAETGEEYRYGEMWEKVSRLASALTKMGMARGSTIAIISPNSPEFVIAFLAAAATGATVTTVNCLYTPGEFYQMRGITTKE